MKTLYFKCTLLTDVIITQSAATDGHQSTLDYIPGSNFLGICAKPPRSAEKINRRSLLLSHIQFKTTIILLGTPQEPRDLFPSAVFEFCGAA